MPLQQTLHNAVPVPDRPDLLQRCNQHMEQSVWAFIPPDGFNDLLNGLRESLIQVNLQEFAGEIQYCIEEMVNLDALVGFPGTKQFFFMNDDRAKEALSACLLIAEHLNNDDLKGPLLTLIKNLHLQTYLAGSAHILLGANVPHHAPVVVPNINDGQSTHNASVHQAVSESATRLDNRYGLMIDGAGLESVISRVQFYVSNLSDDSEKNKAAKRCVLRITAPDYTFTDPGSHITTRQLLALTFLAICDGGNRVGSLEDARAQFVEGLHEIQRGYNLADTGVDQGGQDRSICSAGTFNKLIEKLQSIHPDCQIRFITRETASLKLPIVVREEAMQYLASLANPSTVEELRAFTQLMSQVKEDGVEVIWDQIKGNITDRMFDEFGSLYRDRAADHSFTSLIDAGQYTELPDLRLFQEQVQNSRGYHQYCSQMLRQSGMFSSPEKSADYLSEHRHDSPAAQREYDQQFGLVLRK